MTDPAISYPSGTAGERRPRQPPVTARCALCIYCRTDRFVYWPSVIWLSLAECPGSQRREAADRDIAPLNGRPAADLSRTTPTDRESPESPTWAAQRRLLASRAAAGTDPTHVPANSASQWSRQFPQPPARSPPR
jgi:hypothetical protein